MSQGAPKQIKVDIDAKDVEGIYSNLAFLHLSPSEFILDFARLMPGPPAAKVHSPDGFYGKTEYPMGKKKDVKKEQARYIHPVVRTHPRDDGPDWSRLVRLPVLLGLQRRADAPLSDGLHGFEVHDLSGAQPGGAFGLRRPAPGGLLERSQRQPIRPFRGCA